MLSSAPHPTSQPSSHTKWWVTGPRVLQEEGWTGKTLLHEPAEQGKYTYHDQPQTVWPPLLLCGSRLRAGTFRCPGSLARLGRAGQVSVDMVDPVHHPKTNRCVGQQDPKVNRLPEEECPGPTSDKPPPPSGVHETPDSFFKYLLIYLGEGIPWCMCGGQRTIYESVLHTIWIFGSNSGSQA